VCFCLSIFQYFRDALRKELGIGHKWLDKMFPQLDDLTHIHMNFLRQLQALQTKRADRLVEEIGPTLNEQVCMSYVLV